MRPRVIFSIGIKKEFSLRDPALFLLALRYLSLISLIVALARPQTSYRQTERIVSGVDIMLVMDVSASMRAEDLGDTSRIEVAKQTMSRFLDGRVNDRIGFTIFSGEPISLVPPTLDYLLVKKAIRDAEIGILKDGTAIGDGLALAVNRLKDSKAKTRVIVLLTDGDNNVGQVGPADAGELAAGYGIRVYTIAIGREGKVKIPITQRGAFGNTITRYQYQDNALNTELLELIAKTTNGRFYRVQDLQTLENVFAEIDQLEKTEVKSNTKVKYDEVFDRPLKVALVLLMVEQFLGKFWWRLLL